jgi:hypothetical protein
MDIKELIGKKIIAIEGCEPQSEVVTFKTDGGTFRMFHYQDCCESVRVEDVDGMPAELAGATVINAEESSNKGEDGKYGESNTWTFYRIWTDKGPLNLRWLGQSNGYYSESVDFEQVKE